MNIGRIKQFSVDIDVPKDKSITHRAFLLASIASGISTIYSPLLSQDTLTTISVLQTLGVSIQSIGDNFVVNGGLDIKDNCLLDAQNSGTTARLIIGLVSGARGAIGKTIAIHGDESLSARPMQRIVDPMLAMGANIASANMLLPVSIKPSILHGARHTLCIASAQVKSAILLAGLHATTETIISGSIGSRNHTELMLKSLSADIDVRPDSISIAPSILRAASFCIPADISSAAFFLVLAAITKDSQITARRIGINPTRTGILDILRQCNINYTLANIVDDIEPYADITVEYCKDIRGFVIEPSIVPYLIDEIPILCVLACFANGATVIRGAGELAFKESNRIQAIAENLRVLGANIVYDDEGLIIKGTGGLIGGGTVDSYGDHRIAMCNVIASCSASNPSNVNGLECINISYPNFLETITSLSNS